MTPGLINPVKKSGQATTSKHSRHFIAMSQSNRTIASSTGVVGLVDKQSKTKAHGKQGQGGPKLSSPASETITRSTRRPNINSQDSNITSTIKLSGHSEPASDKSTLSIESTFTFCEESEIPLTEDYWPDTADNRMERRSSSNSKLKRGCDNHNNSHQNMSKKKKADLCERLSIWGLEDNYAGETLGRLDELILLFLTGQDSQEDAREFLECISKSFESNFRMTLEGLAAARACDVLPTMDLVKLYDKYKELNPSANSVQSIVLSATIGKVKPILSTLLLGNVPYPRSLVRDAGGANLAIKQLSKENVSNPCDGINSGLSAATCCGLKNIVFYECNKETNNRKLRFSINVKDANSNIYIHWMAVIDEWLLEVHNQNGKTLWEAALQCAFKKSFNTDVSLNYRTTLSGKEFKKVHFHSACLPEILKKHVKEENEIKTPTSSRDINLLIELIYSRGTTFNFKEKISSSFIATLMNLGLDESEAYEFLFSKYPIDAIHRHESFDIYFQLLVKSKRYGDRLTDVKRNYGILFGSGLPLPILRQLTDEDFTHFYGGGLNLPIETLWKEAVRWAMEKDFRNFDEILATEQAISNMNSISSIFSKEAVVPILHTMIDQGFDYNKFL